jgi:hypothetical protein
MAQTRRTQDATLREISAELREFADYSRSVADAAVGQARFTWQDRAKWADRLAGDVLAALDSWPSSAIHHPTVEKVVEWANKRENHFYAPRDWELVALEITREFGA